MEGRGGRKGIERHKLRDMRNIKWQGGREERREQVYCKEGREWFVYTVERTGHREGTVAGQRRQFVVQSVKKVDGRLRCVFRLSSPHIWTASQCMSHMTVHTV